MSGNICRYSSYPNIFAAIRARQVRDGASFALACAFAFATVSVAAIVDSACDIVRSDKLAFGRLAHQPWRVAGAETIFANVTDIGTGSYTVLKQIAAEMLGLPVERVRMELGDSDFPATPGFGGSWGVQRYRGAQSRVSVDARQSPCRDGDE